jgi:S-adenosyl methyltransferase
MNAQVGLNTDTPNTARIWDWFLGGKDNFAADRAAGEQLIRVCEAVGAPTGRDVAYETRAFITRAVTYLAAEAGVRQFIDFGAGLPTQGNVHEVAQAVDPTARVVYVDYDPVVVRHGQALLADNTTTIAVAGDLRHPLEVLADPDVRRLLDFTQPVAALLVSVLHLLPDEDQAAGVVAQLRGALPPGSYLALSHVTGDARPELAERIAAEVIRLGVSTPLVPRSHAQIGRFLTGFDLVDPGLVYISRWGPTPDDDDDDGARWMYAAVGHLPDPDPA